jgi:3-hydroxyacyl-CoA dehydrogenase
MAAAKLPAMTSVQTIGVIGAGTMVAAGHFGRKSGRGFYTYS